MNIKTPSTPRGFNRRKFLCSSAIVSAAASLPMTALAQGRRVENVGLQLYTLRNEMSQDFEGTLAKVADLGFKEMEFAGYFGRSASEVRRTLDQNGMTSPAAHIQLQALRDDLEGEVEAYDLGQKTLSDEIGELENDERIDEALARLKAKMAQPGTQAESA